MDLLSVYFGKGFVGVREILFNHLILPPTDPEVTRIAKQRRRHMKNQKHHSTRGVRGNPYKGPHPTVVAHKDLKLLAQTSRFWHEKIKKFRWRHWPKVMHMEVSHMQKVLTTKNSIKKVIKIHEAKCEAMIMNSLIEWIDSL